MVNKEQIKVKPNTYDRLDKRKGFNGCITFDDVINHELDSNEVDPNE